MWFGDSPIYEKIYILYAYLHNVCISLFHLCREWFESMATHFEQIGACRIKRMFHIDRHGSNALIDRTIP